MRRPTWLNLVACSLLAGAVFATFSRAANCPFFFDDYTGIVDNASIRQLWPLAVPLRPPLLATTTARPLVNLSFAVNYHFGQLQPLGYRLVNMAIHAVSAILLFSIVRCTLLSGKFSWLQTATDQGDLAAALAFVVALVWAVHPLQTEAVCYATQRTELMVGLFLFATVYSGIRYWQAESPGTRRLWLALAVAACAAGMASKEVMVTAPVLVLLYDYTFSDRPVRQLLPKSWPLYLGLAGTWLLLAYLIADMPRARSAGFHLGVPAATWWLTQAKVLTMYLRLAFWPWPQSIHYDFPYLTSLHDAWHFVAFVTLLVLATLAGLSRRQPIGYVGAWFFIILSPTLVIPIITEIAAERRMYLPLAAVVSLVFVGACRFTQMLWQRASEKWILVAGGLLALALAAVSYQRLAAYQTESTIWFDALAQFPQSDVVQISLAAALRNERRDAEALDHYREAVRLNPTNADFRFKYANCLGAVGDRSAAVHEFQAAVKLAPDVPDYHNNYGNTLRLLKQYPDAVDQFTEALTFQPDMRDARYNLALTLSAMNKPQEAIRQYQQLTDRNPTDAQAQFALANELLAAGLKEGAVHHFRSAIQLRPEFSDARNNLGAVLLDLGRTDEAVAQFEAQVRAEPDSPIGQFNLATALSDAGRMSDALPHARRALELARAGGQTELAKQIEAWLAQSRTADSP